jgi:hypothetical protein
VPNKSEILHALEWVDRAARDGEALMLDKARRALEEEIHSERTSGAPDLAYKTAVESFVRKHGREPLEDIRADED